MTAYYSLAPALCLDFDGTIRYSKSGAKFIKDAEDIALFDGVEEIVFQYRNEGYLIFGVTNQGGVAYGFKSTDEIEIEIGATIRLFQRENPFHFVASCPHHENGTVKPYNHRSLLRKPSVGMLVMCEQSAWQNGFIVDWDNSIFVGDRPEDERCAKNAGIEFRWAKDFFGRGE